MRPIVRFYPCPPFGRLRAGPSARFPIWRSSSGQAILIGRLAQLVDLSDFDWTCSSTVERFVYIEDVGGSNPSKSTKLRQSPVRRGVALHRKCRGFEPLSVHAQYLLSFSA